MPLVPLPKLLDEALEGGYAIGYFESWDSYSFEAALEIAEEENSPIIVGFGAMMLTDEWLDGRHGIEALGAMGRRLLEGVRVPVSFLLNETHTLEQAQRGVDSGFNFVMIDSQKWPKDAAMEASAKLVEYAHPHGVAVEAEFGSLPDFIGGQIVDEYASRTDPDEAAEYVRVTGIDALAVSVGNVHLLTAYKSEIDIPALQAIRAAVPNTPLVLHGGTGFPDEAVRQAIQNGVAKFNVGTRLKKNFLEAVVARTKTWTGDESPHDLVGSHKETDFLEAGKKAFSETVRDFLRLYGSAGKADEVLKAVSK
jgi:fructose-bisphosphate aldolase class II